MASYGDEIDVNDYGVCKLTERKTRTLVYLVEEEDGSINWYLNPDYHSDKVLTTRYVKFVRER